MNVTASKLLLGLSVAAYTYCSWDHLFAHEQAKPAASKGKELTAAIVNRVEVLALAGDPFGAPRYGGGAAPEDAKKQAAIAGFLDDGAAEGPLPPLTLQGIFLTPGGHIALVNGKAVEEGQIAELEPGKARIFARRIGEDFAVIEGGGQQQVLRLETPTGQKSTAHADGAAPAAAPRKPIYQSRVARNHD